MAAKKPLSQLNTSPPVSSSVSESEAQSSVTSEMITDPNFETTTAIDNLVSFFEAALKNSNLNLKEKTVKDAASLGALEGYGLYINISPLALSFLIFPMQDMIDAHPDKETIVQTFLTIVQ